MSAFRSKRTFRSRLRFALSSFLPYLVRISIRLASPDPALVFFGSHRKKRERCIGVTYPYVRHLHRLSICIYLTYTYDTLMHILCICAGLGWLSFFIGLSYSQTLLTFLSKGLQGKINDENRIYFQKWQQPCHPPAP